MDPRRDLRCEAPVDVDPLTRGFFRTSMETLSCLGKEMEDLIRGVRCYLDLRERMVRRGYW